jgi:Na+(H+)/acetate symporter ActP
MPAVRGGCGGVAVFVVLGGMDRFVVWGSVARVVVLSGACQVPAMLHPWRSWLRPRVASRA